MRGKWYITVVILAVVLVMILFVSFQNREDTADKEELQNVAEISVTDVEANKEANKETEQKEEFSFENEDVQNDMEEFWLEEEMMELTDFAELPIEEFIKETEIPLYQKEEGRWSTEGKTIQAKTNNSRIISLSVNYIRENEKQKQLVEAGEFPYTIAGIKLNDNVSYLEDTILKDAVRVSSGGLGRDYYTSLDLSRFGIERLMLEHEEMVGHITADFDMSLKENADGLEYIWEEKTHRKEGADVVALVKYPCIEIPGHPQMTQNANNLILEAVERIGNRTYWKTNENILVKADYWISYTTSRFISIEFRIYVTDGETRRHLVHFCNINIEKNGEGALLSEVGITKETVANVCGVSQEPLDTESYLEGYDTNWDQYGITPIAITFNVKYIDINDEMKIDCIAVSMPWWER